MRQWPPGLAVLAFILSVVGQNDDNDVLLLQKELRLRSTMPNPQRWTCEDRCIPAVWVVSPGRSGSTTVLEMLNAIPGFELMGENENMWGTVYTLFSERRTAWENYRKKGQYMAWRQSEEMDWKDILCGYQLRVLAEMNPPDGVRVVGFKEIRWAWGEGLADLDLLLQVFPCSAAVLNYRMDLKAERESRTEAAGVFPSVRLDVATEAMLKFHKEHQTRSFLLPLENFSTDLFNNLLKFLGEDQCTFTDVLHDNAQSGYTHGNWRKDPDVINCTGT
mmetsp:Transcript_13989/g.26120  ORF Transcript_13989/g.26120 Transcript_13989/m.26120 type:complete len:276 (-) Transcript_13989:67-894(-)